MPQDPEAALHQAAADLILVEAQLRAAAIVVAGALMALSDAMKAESKRRREARRQARQAAPEPAR